MSSTRNGNAFEERNASTFNLIQKCEKRLKKKKIWQKHFFPPLKVDFFKKALQTGTGIKLDPHTFS